MFQAAFIEDDFPIQRLLSEKLIHAFRQENETLMLTLYNDGSEFLKMIKEHYHFDIVFLDIEMPGIDGFTLAQRMRAEGSDVPLVFISNHDSLVFRTFEVQPFRFIRKQDFDAMLPQLVSDLLTKLRIDKRQSLFITEPGTGDIYSFGANSLLYIEAQQKDCRLVTGNGEVIIRCSLNQLEAQLQSCGFMKCHRSYLVNWRSIFIVGKTSIKLVNSEEIPLSRGLRQSFRAAYIRAVSLEG